MFFIKNFTSIILYVSGIPCLPYLLVSLLVCIQFCIVFHLQTNKFPSKTVVLGVFVFSHTFVVVLGLLSSLKILSFAHGIFVDLLGLSCVTFTPLILYAIYLGDGS